ncbi:MAG: winged helix-turn-helix transcriptional regulator [Thermocrispum sp.]
MPLRSYCPIAGTLDIVGDRWSLLIVRDLLYGERRYGDLATSWESIPTNTLADRLKRLEDAEIVARERYSDRPPRYSYRLTGKGRALGPILEAITEWGLAHIPGTRVVSPPAAGSAAPATGG